MSKNLVAVVFFIALIMSDILFYQIGYRAAMREWEHSTLNLGCPQ